MHQDKKMQRNIHLFGIYKVFTKRVFLPLTTIYATQAAGLSIAQIGTATALASFVSLFFETTTGYWADTHGRRKSSLIGAALAALSTALYIVSANFWGIVAAGVVQAIGYSFLSGAMEALIHDSLVVLKKEHDYAKIASRAQALSLVANAIFIATVPLLYPIDKRLPFVAGFFAYVSLFFVAWLLTEPATKHHADQKLLFYKAVRKVITKDTFLFFACVGLAYAVVGGVTDNLNLGLKELGLKPEYTGFVFAAASLLAAAAGFFVHHLKRLSFKQFAALDITTSALVFVGFGFIQSLPIAMAVFMINMAFWRYQKIMYQHYVLELYGNGRYKATLMSLMSNFALIHEVWLALVFTKIAASIGVLPSLRYGVLLTALLLPLFLYSIYKLQTAAKASFADANHLT